MELNRISLTTDRQSGYENQIYFKDKAKLFALTATMAVPVLFNSFDMTACSSQATGGVITRFSGTTDNTDYTRESKQQARQQGVSMAELAKVLFPAPIELSGETAKKHRKAISSFFKKT